MKIKSHRIFVYHEKKNRWIVICIDYNNKWSTTRAISNVIAKTLIEFVINDIYRDYETFQKIIIDKEVNLWTTTMKLIFETLKIKHKDITLYHSRINKAIKKFNDVFDHILMKYCIDEFIKNWNLYLNQTLFATRIRTHIIIDFFFFYLLYEVNSNLFDDVENSISNRYDERIDSISFLSRDKVETFKKIMTRAMKNKVV